MSRKKIIRMLIGYLKRSFDLYVSCFALVLLLPIILTISLIIKINSIGPVFYREMRVGKLTKEKITLFKIIKFRTMYQHSKAHHDPLWTTKNDPRITSFGKFLRKTHLDEIPQFINVIKGEMSIIGPRPESLSFYKKLDKAIPFFSDRTYQVIPGITGLAQVNQEYDTCIEDVIRKVGFDHSYALSLSSFQSWIAMDINIIKKTILIMINGHRHRR
ncbi:putative colanic biosynthesis UDP-glucose lipid carrier transferase [Candidatus Photodesmus katoptron]|uniref:Putative undecaprenyl-phosphate N-acetylgalactosaminyl-phosphatetransferase n=2 Tax=Candidatus Photodesmus anomalopis TaxID=28176 RepID=S3DZN1_9GAMM|nr:sugar transferase [Candidatus Photodesmus katoptron]EPE37401.1 putative undecaprenyl-phosphate N-acetylgalactosaminyl -phosphatetransferase [Candidatus Photodesmus katoptron Akat1]KEY90808.1 putative colanic biosynthesis UDP-glucose lipid carrier transferase [Candidatus Photodesmus katoptron]